MKFFAGIVLGAVLSIGTVSMFGQEHEHQFHPRLRRAIEALRDARGYMEAAPHDFGGHKADAMRATDEAIHQLEICSQYRDRR